MQTICTKNTFDKTIPYLHKEGYQLASLEDVARERLSDSCENWSTRVSEAFIYMPDKGVFLSKHSPILEDLEAATDCHRKGIEVYISDEQLERALTDSVEIKNTYIPTSEFGSYEETRFAFGSYAKDYGLLLNRAGIEKMHLWLCSNDTKAFARQARIRGIDQKSILDSLNLNAYTNALGTKASH